jgi:hypothetical protein
VQWIDTPHPRLRFQPFLLNALPWLSLLLIAGAVGAGIVRTVHDFKMKNTAPEQALFNYVDLHKASGQNYLIPLKLQDFRLATGAPAFVDFKSIPYTDDAVQVWYSRVMMAGEFYQGPGCAHLYKFLDGNKVSNIVIGNDPHSSLDCPGVALIYQDSAYKLYSLDIPTFLKNYVK